MEENTKINIYLYGTLKTGTINNVHLNLSKYYIKSVIIRGFGMVNMGGFPCIVEDIKKSIIAELYSIPKNLLVLIDKIEGYPTFYNRQIVKDVDGDSGFIYMVESVNNDYKNKKNKYNEILSGNWIN